MKVYWSTGQHGVKVLYGSSPPARTSTERCYRGTAYAVYSPNFVAIRSRCCNCRTGRRKLVYNIRTGKRRHHFDTTHFVSADLQISEKLMGFLVSGLFGQSSLLYNTEAETTRRRKTCSHFYMRRRTTLLCIFAKNLRKRSETSIKNVTFPDPSCKALLRLLLPEYSSSDLRSKLSESCCQTASSSFLIVSFVKGRFFLNEASEALWTSLISVMSVGGLIFAPFSSVSPI